MRQRIERWRNALVVRKVARDWPALRAVLDDMQRTIDKLKSKETQMSDLHPGTAHVLAFFAYDHLPEHLQEISKPFSELAHDVAYRANNPETTVALRKLLEAKDAAVRAAL